MPRMCLCAKWFGRILVSELRGFRIFALVLGSEL